MDVRLWAKHASNELQMLSNCSENTRTKASELWRIASARHSWSELTPGSKDASGLHCHHGSLFRVLLFLWFRVVENNKVLYSPGWPWTPNPPSIFQVLGSHDKQTGVLGPQLGTWFCIYLQVFCPCHYDPLSLSVWKRKLSLCSLLLFFMGRWNTEQNFCCLL